MRLHGAHLPFACPERITRNLRCTCILSLHVQMAVTFRQLSVRAHEPPALELPPADHARATPAQSPVRGAAVVSSTPVSPTSPVSPRSASSREGGLSGKPSSYHLRGDKSGKSDRKVVITDREIVEVVGTDRKMPLRPVVVAERIPA
jgi:hypothetical protein